MRQGRDEAELARAPQRANPNLGLATPRGEEARTLATTQHERRLGPRPATSASPEKALPGLHAAGTFLTTFSAAGSSFNQFLLTETLRTSALPQLTSSQPWRRPNRPKETPDPARPRPTGKSGPVVPAGARRSLLSGGLRGSRDVPVA